MNATVAGEHFYMKRECTASERRRVTECYSLPSARRRSAFAQALIQGHAMRRLTAIGEDEAPREGKRHRSLGLFGADGEVPHRPRRATVRHGKD